MAHPINTDIHTTAALKPPQGQSSNLINPYSTNSHLIVTYSICLTIIIFSIAIRTFVKSYVHREVRIEDC